MQICILEYASMQEIICKKCGYAWQYAGTKRRTSCSKCKTSITLPAVNVYRVPIALPVNNISLPLKLLDSLAFERAKAWAKTNGEDIKLKTDDKGILSLT